ncbi:hypothetical protein [Actinospongicola halichondriae]
MRTIIRARIVRVRNPERRTDPRRSADVDRMRAAVVADARQPFIR